MKASEYFSAEEKDRIIEAVKKAELNTSGEIRVHIENDCKADVLDRASLVFAKLNMHKTEKRNGVLVYLALNDHKFAIIGDAGINAVVKENFWEETKEIMLTCFKESNLCEGLVRGIEKAGEQLKQFFPYQSDDVNELPDDISFNS